MLCLSVPARSIGAEIDISGVYRCVGTNPDGSPYRGVVEIVENDFVIAHAPITVALPIWDVFRGCLA